MIKDIDEAIAHAREVAKDMELCCEECAREHEQLASWLTELAERRETDRWIPVSERLPEEFGDYLVFTSEKEIDIGTFVPEFVNSWSMCNVDGFYWVKQKGIEITHWKPLPKFYENEGE